MAQGVLPFKYEEEKTAILGEGMKNRLSLDFLLGGCFSTQEVRGKWQP